MVVRYLDVKGVPSFPPKTDTPLVVDANAVLSQSVALQSFETIAGRYPQILQFDSIFEESQSSPCHLEQITGESLYPLPLPDTLCEPIPEALDHAQ
jgi:hypothetical protein